METETKNAIITDAIITNDDHGVLSSWIYLDYGGSGQGFGGYCLYQPNFRNESPNIAGHFIWRVMEVIGVSKWSDLKGKTIRAVSTHDKVVKIGHIVKNIWFDPSQEFSDMKSSNDLPKD